MNYAQSESLFERAQAVIPGGIPGIRSPDNFVPGAYPILLASGKGGRITDVDGNEFVDLMLGYGPVMLGHGEAEVDEAAYRQASSGFCLNVPKKLMIELAERLIAMIPSAEQAMFFKTGSGATTGAVRFARAQTGRNVVLRCGYHGWHDWCIGPDAGVDPLSHEGVYAFPYNDLDALETLLRQHAGQVACIIITPIGHEFDAQIEPPAPGYLQGVRRLADDNDVVLIFDEVRSGFRVAQGGAQELYGVTPDLTAIGKAMGNGYAIAAVVGKRRHLASANKTFISSTYFPNSLEMAAAITTLDIIQREDVVGAIAQRGIELADGMKAVVKEFGLPVTLSPYTQMPFAHFEPNLDSGQPERRDRFYASLAAHGVFAHPRHHGFICWRHTDEDVEQVLSAYRNAATGI
jgi:glutamate-1-semialdehyde aminotransferase